jgi:glycosyltransferase involved in cell wall biosynthesis
VGNVDVLILTKDIDSKGGVASLYRLLKKHFNYERIELDYFYVGSSSVVYKQRNKRIFSYIIDSIGQFNRFRTYCKKSKPDIVVLNPSLIPVSLIRDGIYLLIAKYYNVKAIIFIHGWRNNTFERIKKNVLLRSLFIEVYDKADTFIVLSNSFHDWLSTLLPETPIYTLFIPYDDTLIHDYIDISNRSGFIFLSRISERKGIKELMEVAQSLLQAGHTQFSLKIYGHFANIKIEKWVKNYLDSHPEIRNSIYIGGFIDGDIKYSELRKSEVFVLPSWEEGCPTALIEAMAAGCYTIASNVGAIPEIITNNWNGQIINPKSKTQLSSALETFMRNRNELLTRCLNNRKQTNEKYDIKVFADRLTDILLGLIQ